jgi:hypothetical protein
LAAAAAISAVKRSAAAKPTPGRDVLIENGPRRCIPDSLV